MVYVVFSPVKKGGETVYAVFEDIKEAKDCASRLRDKYLSKGWDSWAKRVSIRKPTNPDWARDLANQLVRAGNGLDMMNQGRTFRGDGQVIACGMMDAFYHWAELLRKYAKATELA